MQKQLEGAEVLLMSSADRVAAAMGNSCNIVSNTRASQRSINA